MNIAGEIGFSVTCPGCGYVQRHENNKCACVTFQVDLNYECDPCSVIDSDAISAAYQYIRICIEENNLKDILGTTVHVKVTRNSIQSEYDIYVKFDYEMSRVTDL